jgi:hypothetical protein
MSQKNGPGYNGHFLHRLSAKKPGCHPAGFAYDVVVITFVGFSTKNSW